MSSHTQDACWCQMAEPCDCVCHDPRLEYLRGELEAGSMSWGELAELQSLGRLGLIPEWDVQLREAAGLPEFPDIN